jgi:pantetheine-phosphate adenylyltransferase
MAVREDQEGRVSERDPARAGLYRIGLYPGTFDPLTNGHLDIIERAAKMVDKLVIGVAINADKAPLFSLDERVAMVEHACRGHSRAMLIDVRPFDTLLVKFAAEVGAGVIIRGLRAVSDFEYEFQMVGMNQKLTQEIETVFLMADPTCQAIASRLVKEIARLEGDVSEFVPPEVKRRLKAKFGRRAEQ